MDIIGVLEYQWTENKLLSWPALDELVQDHAVVSGVEASSPSDDIWMGGPVVSAHLNV